MSSSRVVKSPTDVDVVPTSTELPFVDARICMRSANVDPIVRVQNVIDWPGLIATSGVSSQFEIVATSAPFW